MYKRPQIRQRFLPTPSRTQDLQPGTLLYSITHPAPTKRHEHVVTSVYRQEDYVRLLMKNNRELGLEVFEPHLPNYTESVRAVKYTECHIRTLNPVHLQLRVLKNGVIRVKLTTSLYDMYEKYYAQQKQPSLKVIVQTYKSLGYSDEFLERVIKSHDKKLKIVHNFNLDSIFNKESMKKQQQKKKKEDEELKEDEDMEDEEEDDDPCDDEGMDIEQDEDDDIVEQNDEEFIDEDDP